MHGGGPPSGGVEEVDDEFRDLGGFFHLREVAAVGDSGHRGIAQGLGIGVAGADRHDLIVVTPDDLRRRAYTAEQMWQRLAVHVWFPRGAETHLAANVPLFELVGID